ncbi:acetoin utilization deacetylase AcuC-like enzyme [Hoeflea halophila]|uniref:Acetoin utilization deacetylase AcuC-like enzyme n=1 Tax=Hoeflea halophila TaxID=714899 RepID=A0A286IC37_9HYPH|nr:histone deacetylase family protein [Hoeflea halophila]SOE17688.1 acetoin utilization deacetylase AcuC-like enzyme [Hoeflea halophila]
MTTFYYSNPICLEHLVPAGHPERPDRMKALEAVFEHEHFNTLVRHVAPEAAAETVLLAHPESYLEKIRKAIPETGFSRIDSDTTASPRSMESALISVGGAMAAVDAVFRKEADNVFVATRPPGHHAEKNTSMGFCLFNQAAIAARHAQKAHGAERVAIIDWDVHHGNGTQDIFYDDPSVVYCSTHQMPLYPGTGALRETGKGNIFNAPLSTNDGSDHFREAFRSRILPALEEARPDLIIISAGFDAHHRDPLAEINLVADDFDWATGKVMEIAGRHCGNRVVSLLEGGYDLVGLAESAAAHVIRLQEG